MSTLGERPPVPVCLRWARDLQYLYVYVERERAQGLHQDDVVVEDLLQTAAPCVHPVEVAADL